MSLRTRNADRPQPARQYGDGGKGRGRCTVEHQVLGKDKPPLVGQGAPRGGGGKEQLLPEIDHQRPCEDSGKGGSQRRRI